VQKIEHQQNDPCTLLITLQHFFTEKIMVRQERKKHPPPTTRSTHAMEKPFFNGERTNKPNSGWNQNFWV